MGEFIFLGKKNLRAPFAKETFLGQIGYNIYEIKNGFGDHDIRGTKIAIFQNRAQNMIRRKDYSFEIKFVQP